MRVRILSSRRDVGPLLRCIGFTGTLGGPRDLNFDDPTEVKVLPALIGDRTPILDLLAIPSAPTVRSSQFRLGPKRPVVGILETLPPELGSWSKRANIAKSFLIALPRSHSPAKRGD